MNTENYIEKVIFPYFNGFLNQDLNMCLYDANGTVLAITGRSALRLGVTPDKIIGMSYDKVSPEIIEQMCTIHDPDDVEKILAACKKITKINEVVVVEKRIINYVDVIPYKNIYEASLVTQFPVFDTNNNVIAIQSLSTPFHLYGIGDYISKLNNCKQLAISKAPEISIDLSIRQHEILFLLLVGMSQTEIALILGIKRGTVSTIIGSQLCPKFGIHGSNTKLLLHKAKELNIEDYVPPSLDTPRVI